VQFRHPGYVSHRAKSHLFELFATLPGRCAMRHKPAHREGKPTCGSRSTTFVAPPHMLQHVTPQKGRTFSVDKPWTSTPFEGAKRRQQRYLSMGICHESSAVLGCPVPETCRVVASTSCYDLRWAGFCRTTQRLWHTLPPAPYSDPPPRRRSVEIIRIP
jgi:hypothetical protein